jgi:16S rRNA pseudouridine516 synthase
MPKSGAMPRLDQLIASLGYGSRKEVRGWIEAGRVLVRDVAATDPGARVEPAEVRIDGAALDHPGELLILLNKPAGRVCSHASDEGPSVFGLLPERWQKRNPPVTSVGRLDKETTGLLLLTDRSALVHRLTSPRNKVAKTYRATLDRELPADAEDIFSQGRCVLPGEDEPCAPATLRRFAPLVAEIVVTEGRYHQVRRMFATLGCTVVELHRLRFGELELANLAPGEWKELPIGQFDPP